MEWEGEAFFTDMADRRNVKATAETRGKVMGMVTKSYNHKAVEKIMYTREEKQKRSKETKQTDNERREKMKEDANWALDPASQKRLKTVREKEAKTEEKTRKRQEIARLYAAEIKANGIKNRPKYR